MMRIDWRISSRNYTDVHVALFEDAIVSEQTLNIVAHLQEWLAERLDIIDLEAKQP